MFSIVLKFDEIRPVDTDIYILSLIGIHTESVAKTLTHLYVSESKYSQLTTPSRHLLSRCAPQQPKKDTRTIKHPTPMKT